MIIGARMQFASGLWQSGGLKYGHPLSILAQKKLLLII
jgi:hypothetical protein